ncbi:hypothetical protein RUND412_006129 [Rhizina undulata]
MPSPKPAMATPSESLLDRVRLFCNPRPDTAETSHFTRVGQFDHVTEAEYKQFVHTLYSLDFSVRGQIDYFGDRGLLVITLPSLPHEMMTDYYSSIHSALREQGFWWPAWGNDPLKVIKSGSTDIKLFHRGKQEIFQPDASLMIFQVKLPFLVIEIADTQGYALAWNKARRMLLHSKGQIRFVILIKLIRKTKKEIMEERAIQEPGEEEDDETEADLNSSSKKRSATRDSREESTKRARIPTNPNPPKRALLHPPPTRTPAKTLSRPCRPLVLTTFTLEERSPSLRTLRTLVDAVEFWPTAPSATFEFTWDDLPAPSYPSELAGRSFTFRFDKLHDFLATFIAHGVPRADHELPQYSINDDDEFTSASEAEEEADPQAKEKAKEKATSGESSSGRAESDSDWLPGRS